MSAGTSFTKYLMEGEPMKTYRGKPKWGLYVTEYVDRNDLDDSNVIITVLSQHDDKHSIYMTLEECKALVDGLLDAASTLNAKIAKTRAEQADAE